MPVAVSAHADVLRFPDFAHNCAEVNDILKYAGEHVESGKLVNVIDKKCADGFKHETELVALLKMRLKMTVSTYIISLYTTLKRKIHFCGSAYPPQRRRQLRSGIARRVHSRGGKNGLITDIGNIVLKRCAALSAETG